MEAHPQLIQRPGNQLRNTDQRPKIPKRLYYPPPKVYALDRRTLIGPYAGIFPKILPHNHRRAQATLTKTPPSREGLHRLPTIFQLEAQ